MLTSPVLASLRVSLNQRLTQSETTSESGRRWVALELSIFLLDLDLYSLKIRALCVEGFTFFPVDMMCGGLREMLKLGCAGQRFSHKKELNKNLSAQKRERERERESWIVCPLLYKEESKEEKSIDFFFLIVCLLFAGSKINKIKYWVFLLLLINNLMVRLYNSLNMFGNHTTMSQWQWSGKWEGEELA